MKSLKILILFLLIQNKALNQDTIYWSPSHLLKYEDFQGQAISNSQYGAMSCPGIKYSLFANEDSFNIRVYCYFIRSKSWVRVTSENGLIHEQGHFDIAELFARKLRKTFDEHKFNFQNIGADVNQLFVLNKQERTKMDSLYDQETDFSRNRQQQLLWNNKIKIELDKLKNYSSF